MKQGQIKNVSVHELQSNVSRIIKDVESGQVYRVMRYSSPAAVVIPYEDYEYLRDNCRKCVKTLREDLERIVGKKVKTQSSNVK